MASSSATAASSSSDLIETEIIDRSSSQTEDFINLTMSSSSSSLSRSLSCPSRSVSSFPADLIGAESVDRSSSSQTEDHRVAALLLLPLPSTDFIKKSVDEESGQVKIDRHFHEHPLVLSRYLNFNQNVDEFNFCCFCKLYFTVGASIYSCVGCYMSMHQSCGELPMWISSTRHPQHELLLTVNTNYEARADDYGGKERVLTCRYECIICKDYLGIEQALQGIMPISLFKNTCLHCAVSPSLPLYLERNRNTTTPPPKEEDLRVMVSRRKVKRINHFSHVEHPLILSKYLDVREILEENEWCYLCGKHFTEAETIIYSCKECNYDHFTDFSVHTSCAGLPEWIKTTLHPEHLLQFRPPTEKNFYCNECGKDIAESSTRYTCEVCDFDLHFECVLDRYYPDSLLGKSRCSSLLPKATTPSLSRSLSFPMERGRKDQIIFSEPPPNVRGISLTKSSFFNFRLACVENNVDRIRHFSHEHPLFFLIFKIEYTRDQERNCKICNVTILPDNPVYGCHECEFYIHESCAKIPQTMRSTLHPAHMLQLIPVKHYLDCQICVGEEFNKWVYCYGCKDCAIYFHCGCASAYSYEDHKAQGHTFHIVKPSLFTCDGCGAREDEERFSFMCTSCPMQVHKRCSGSFPRSVKQKRHHHKLSLTYSFEVDFDYANETCRICFNQMNEVYCMYQCTRGCSYMAHVSCATSKDILEDDESTEDESIVSKKDEAIEGQQVEHFAHPDHPLILTKEEPKNDTLICNACISPIISAPFYACAATDDECNFYLHKQCFELPLEFQHPLHEHRLTLTFKEGFFNCYGCGFLCNGFKYSCDDCWFYIDVRCSLLSDTLKHDGHECTLTLIDYDYVRDDEDTTAPKCSACDGLSYRSPCKFSCRKCNFHLDLGCALLPKTVTHECPKHDWKPHPLQLTYGGIPDASGIYFCDMCEESRDINHWFYDCDDCPWSNHPKCVLGEFQFNYGETYKSDVHEHKLKLVKKATSRYNVISCGYCRDHLTHDSPLFCGECNKYFHISCMFRGI